MFKFYLGIPGISNIFFDYEKIKEECIVISKYTILYPMLFLQSCNFICNISYVCFTIFSSGTLTYIFRDMPLNNLGILCTYGVLSFGISLNFYFISFLKNIKFE